jgi:hypothetical protein
MLGGRWLSLVRLSARLANYRVRLIEIFAIGTGPHTARIGVLPAQQKAREKCQHGNPRNRRNKKPDSRILFQVAWIRAEHSRKKRPPKTARQNSRRLSSLPIPTDFHRGPGQTTRCHWWRPPIVRFQTRGTPREKGKRPIYGASCLDHESPAARAALSDFTTGGRGERS